MGVNLYEYVLDNPLRWIDSFGLCCSCVEFNQLVNQQIQDSRTLGGLVNNPPPGRGNWWDSSNPNHSEYQMLNSWWTKIVGQDSTAIQQCADNPCPHPCKHQAEMCYWRCIDGLIAQMAGTKSGTSAAESSVEGVSQTLAHALGRAATVYEVAELVRGIAECANKCQGNP